MAPGSGEALLVALDALLDQTADGRRQTAEAAARSAGVDVDAVVALADLLRDAGEDVVVVWGERLTHGERGAQAARALLNVAGRLGLRDAAGAGLLEIPAGSNGRGLREAGVLPNAGPGLRATAAEGRDAAGIAAGLAAGELSALYLLHADPIATHPDRGRWEAALHRASAVIAHASFLTEGLREHATVVFPAESYAEKEGTVTHPDGRLQRLRPAIGHPERTRAQWSVLADLSARLGHDLGVLTGPMATAQLVDAVPFYRGLTLEAIGGRGLRWPARAEASELDLPAERGPFELEPAPEAPSPNGALRLGTYRSIWASPAVETSPSLKFLHPERQDAELSPVDARRLGIADGDTIEVAADGLSVEGIAHLRDATPAGTVFLEENDGEDSATRLTNGVPRLVEVRRA
jgi:NADH-quinone oxidoreductase subunit G